MKQDKKDQGSLVGQGKGKLSKGHTAKSSRYSKKQPREFMAFNYFRWGGGEESGGGGIFSVMGTDPRKLTRGGCYWVEEARGLRKGTSW